MRTKRILAGGLLVVTAAGCSGADRTPSGAEGLVAPVFAQGDQLGTHMHGAEETPPRPSRAQGQLLLSLSPDGTELHYKVLVAGIDDVTMAHIHLAPPGEPGPAVAWLYPAAPPAQLISGRSQGLLAEGVITDADVVGPLAGLGVDGLLEAIEEGNAYANVHTSLYPPGEIRGQVK